MLTKSNLRTIVAIIIINLFYV